MTLTSEYPAKVYERGIEEVYDRGNQINSLDLYEIPSRIGDHIKVGIRCHSVCLILDPIQLHKEIVVPRVRFTENLQLLATKNRRHLSTIKIKPSAIPCKGWKLTPLY
jgi:hypothetical protein